MCDMPLNSTSALIMRPQSHRNRSLPRHRRSNRIRPGRSRSQSSNHLHQRPLPRTRQKPHLPHRDRSQQHCHLHPSRPSKPLRSQTDRRRDTPSLRSQNRHPRQQRRNHQRQEPTGRYARTLRPSLPPKRSRPPPHAPNHPPTPPASRPHNQHLLRRRPRRLPGHRNVLGVQSCAGGLHAQLGGGIGSRRDDGELCESGACAE